MDLQEVVNHERNHSDTQGFPPNVEFYTVRDNGMMVYDIQYTLNPNGNSPLAGQEVTVKGIVTSSTKIGDLGYLYIQDETGSAWSGIWCVGIGLNTYYRNEEVEITGVVEEYYGMTRLNVTSSSKTGNLGTVAPTILDPSDSASYANFGQLLACNSRTGRNVIKVFIRI